MKNIFQGNDAITKCIAESLGYTYDVNDDLFKYGWFTKDFYFESFFYLTNRFGAPVNFDESKTAGTWRFKVKDFIIEITFTSSDVSFIIFGEKWHQLGGLSTGMVKYLREQWKVKSELVRFDGQCKTQAERALFDTVLKDFWHTNNIKSVDDMDNDYWFKWFEYANEYNSKIVNVNIEKINERYGEIYSNSYTRRALKTLKQFLHNMLTDIYIRDVSYNLEGRSNGEFDKYEGNIEITKL